MLSVNHKGVLHTTGGYMVYTATTFKYAFDYKPLDIYWYFTNLKLFLFSELIIRVNREWLDFLIYFFGLPQF